MLKHPQSSNVRQNFIIGFVVLLVLGGAYMYMTRGETPEDRVNSNITQNSNQPRGEESEETEEIDGVEIPLTLKLKVPFTPQAPTANWDELHNEACEEASAIMANAYYNGIQSLPPATVEREISKLADYQNTTFGYHLSINSEEVVKMIEDNYGLNAELVNISELTIKRALAENKLVIIPANGQMLGNPNFKQPGPIYHMFVITGYDADNFITNDPGTRNGLNYKYSYSTIEDATGNWNAAAHEVDLSSKKIIIVSK